MCLRLLLCKRASKLIKGSLGSFLPGSLTLALKTHQTVHQWAGTQIYVSNHLVHLLNGADQARWEVGLLRRLSGDDHTRRTGRGSPARTAARFLPVLFPTPLFSLQTFTLLLSCLKRAALKIINKN